MPEQIWLDPVEVATARSQFNLTPWIAEQGIDWDVGAVVAYMAEQSRGSTPVDFSVPNRTVVIPLKLTARNGVTFATARQTVQAKAAMFQREGGWLKRITSSGGTVFADIVNATLRLSGSSDQAVRNRDLEAELSLECKPDFYEAERTLADHVETTRSEIVVVETDVDGDYPARVRVVVDDDQSQSQLGLIWSFRSRHYSAAASADVALNAEALDPLDTAISASLAGATGSSVVTHGTLSTGWTPVLGTNIGGTTFLTHTGTNRLWARYRTTSGTAVQLRAVWDVGDLVFPVENAPVRCNAGTAFFMADLGELRLDPSPVGTHRWQGVIQAKGDVGGENVTLDELWVVNCDEGYGVLTAPVTADAGLVDFSARDEFNQTAGALTGKTLPTGGTWTNVAGDDADDFAVEATGHTAQRAVGGDTLPRLVKAGTASYTDCVVEIVGKVSSTSSGNMGAFARLVDVSNFLAVTVSISTIAAEMDIKKVVGGVESNIAIFNWLPFGVGQYATVRLYANARGNWFAWYGLPGASLGEPLLSGHDPDLATGGVLASGTAGLYGRVVGSASTHNIQSFAAWVPTPDAVIHPSQSCQLTTNGMFREDSTGTGYGPVSHVIGDLPRLPPTVEGRSTEVFVKLSRGDFGSLPDSGIDDLSARVSYSPCWLTVPGS